MKRTLQKIIAVIIAAGLTCGSAVSADTGNITVTGNFTEKFSLDYDNTNFLQTEYMTPGNVYISHIYLKNMSDKDMSIKVSDIEVDSGSGTVSLSDKLYLWIYRGDGETLSDYKERLYYGNYSGGRTEYITLPPYQSETLSVLVALSPDAGNDYQGLTMTSRWNISAVLSDNNLPTETERPTGTNKPTGTDNPTGTGSPAETNKPTGTKRPIKPNKPSGDGGHLIKYKYIINYLDEDGNRLAPSTEGKGFGGRNIYAYAVDIPGYKPDEYKKVFWIHAPETVINFIYTKIDEKESPNPADKPINSDEPKDNTDEGKLPDEEDDPNDGNDPNGENSPNDDSEQNNNGGEDNNGDGSDGQDNGDDPNDGSGSGEDSEGDKDKPNFITRIFKRGSDGGDGPNGGDNGNSSDNNGLSPNKPVKTGMSMFENQSKPLTFTLLSGLLAAVCIPVIFFRKKKKKSAGKKGGEKI